MHTAAGIPVFFRFPFPRGARGLATIDREPSRDLKILCEAGRGQQRNNEASARAASALIFPSQMGIGGTCDCVRVDGGADGSTFGWGANGTRRGVRMESVTGI